MIGLGLSVVLETGSAQDSIWLSVSGLAVGTTFYVNGSSYHASVDNNGSYTLEGLSIADVANLQVQCATAFEGNLSVSVWTQTSDGTLSEQKAGSLKLTVIAASEEQDDLSGLVEEDSMFDDDDGQKSAGDESSKPDPKDKTAAQQPDAEGETSSNRNAVQDEELSGNSHDQKEDASKPEANELARKEESASESEPKETSGGILDDADDSLDSILGVNTNQNQESGPDSTFAASSDFDSELVNELTKAAIEQGKAMNQ